MTKDVSLSLRVDHRLSSKLAKHAKKNGRSKSSMAAWAIEQYLLTEEQEDALTMEALAEAKAGRPFIAHEDMVKWMNSLGTDHELPPPKPTVKP